LKVNPARENARQMRSAVLWHLGFYKEATRDAEEVVLLNPRSAFGAHNLALIASYQGDFGKAIEYLERAREVDPASFITNLFGPIFPLLSGRIGEAREKLSQSHQMVPGEPQITCIEGLIAAHEGDFRRAEQLADEACAEKRKSLTHTHHTWHYAAGVYALCGKPDKAIVELKRCAEFGLANYLLFTCDPFLSSMKNHPDFTALMSDLRRQYEQYREEFAFDTSAGQTSRSGS
jgi:tetratricopeptide (TPR) repeat protein